MSCRNCMSSMLNCMTNKVVVSVAAALNKSSSMLIAISPLLTLLAAHSGGRSLPAGTSGDVQEGR